MKGEALVHFSGGSDSTLCAAMLAERHARVHLMSYDRLSFLGARRYTEKNYRRLCKVYGEAKFVRRVVPVDALHRRICYAGYGRILWRHKLAVTSLAFSKLAMHWFSAAYAIRHGVGTVADGAVPYMELYPDQNARIGLEGLREMYATFGIEYLNPVWDMADQVEERLYDKGIVEQRELRGTDQDQQVYYLEQVILALFLKYYLTRHGREGYVREVGALFRDRIALMTASLTNLRDSPADSFLTKLVEKASA